MSVYDTIREGLENEWRKARSYDYVRDILTEVWKSGKLVYGSTLSARVQDCLNNTPPSSNDSPTWDTTTTLTDAGVD